MKTKPALKKSQKSKKNNSTYSVTYARVITLGVVVALIVSALSINMIVSLRQNTIGSDYSSFQNDINLSKQISRLQFCYEQNIRPCDDDTIEKANRSLPEDSRYNLP